MDQCTHEVRAEYWRKIIQACGQRPAGQSAKRWMDENGNPRAKLLPLAEALSATGLCGNEGERFCPCHNGKIGAGFC